jgi:hypothetical protein
MNPKLNGPRLIAVSLLSILVIVATLLYRTRAPKSAPESTVLEAELIFEGREKTAQQRIGGRLGLLILGNKLESLQEGLKPEPGDEEWFQTLRALFITGKVDSLKPEILQFIQETSLLRLEHSPRNGSGIPDLYQAQIQRLPVPAPNSKSRRILREWALKKDALLQKKPLAFQKLLAQDLNPEPAVLEAMRNILKNTSPEPWAFVILDEVRNPTIRKSLVLIISANLKSYSKSAKPFAVKALASHIGLIPDDYKKIRSASASLIKSDSEMEIEAGIKAMSSILNFKKLDAADAEKLRAWLKAIPDNRKQPAIKAGINLLLVKVGGEAD